MSLFNTIKALAETNNAINSAAYTAARTRFALVHGLRTKANSAYSSKEAADIGLEIFADSLLLAEGAIYLVLSEDRDYDARFACRETFLARVVVLRRDSQNALRAYDATTNEDLGKATPATFRSSIDSDRDVYTAPNYFMNPVLPLSGPVLTHRFGRRLAQLAHAIVADVATFNEIADLEATATKLCAELEANHQAAPIEAMRCYGELITILNEENAELVKLLQTMDWTYQYADRINSFYHDQEMKIRSLLDKLPIDDATALFVAHAGHSWKNVYSFTLRHPDVAAALKAA